MQRVFIAIVCVLRISLMNWECLNYTCVFVLLQSSGLELVLGELTSFLFH